MNLRKIQIWLLIVGCLSSELPAQNLSVIPRPVTMESREGVFKITPAMQVVAVGDAREKANQLIDTFAPAMGFRMTFAEPAKANQAGIVLSLDEALKAKLGAEGYTLSVTSKRIDLRAAGPAGLFYGIQTLCQLLPPAVLSPQCTESVQWVVPCVTITDYPRFQWRGLLIDPARHFIPVKDFKHYIDAMALHKFNRLQVHFTDNIGWRIEIKKYPDLTRLASQRDRSGGKGGFYTQDDIRELVRYAAKRHIEIVPEIEMPYHAGAAINAYPQLGINPARVAGLSPEKRWGKLGGLVAPRTKTVIFMQNVLVEIIDLFPSPFIHIGGDEANLRLWASDGELQAEMKRLGCKDAHELHSWFIKQMDTFLTKHDRRLLGWDEILQGGLAPGATVMSWRGIQHGITAAKAGHDVIMAPTSHTYFNFRQAPEEKGYGRDVIDLQMVYTFEPVPAELDADQAKHVLGGQGQLWGEMIADVEQRDFMTWPRASALIETLWSPAGRRDLELFLARLAPHLKRLKAAGVNYRP